MSTNHVMEGGDEDMEVDVTTQQDDESIKMKTTSTWRIKVNLILKMYKIGDLYLFKKHLLL